MRRILIIDDEEKLRSLLARILSLEGYDIAEAANAKAALKKIEQEAFEVIICDVKLPDGDGLELTQKIKLLQPLTEVIILTAFGSISGGVKAIKHGAFDYITKGDGIILDGCKSQGQGRLAAFGDGIYASDGDNIQIIGGLHENNGGRTLCVKRHGDDARERVTRKSGEGQCERQKCE